MYSWSYYACHPSSINQLTQITASPTPLLDATTPPLATPPSSTPNSTATKTQSTTTVNAVTTTSSLVTNTPLSTNETTSTSTALLSTTVIIDSTTSGLDNTPPPDRPVARRSWWLLAALIVTVIVVIGIGVIFYQRQQTPYRRCTPWWNLSKFRFLRNWRSRDDEADNIILQLEQPDYMNNQWPPRISFA